MLDAMMKQRPEVGAEANLFSHRLGKSMVVRFENEDFANKDELHVDCIRDLRIGKCAETRTC